MADARLSTLCEGCSDELQEIALVFCGNVPLTNPFFDLCTVEAEQLELFLIARKLEKCLVHG